MGGNGAAGYSTAAPHVQAAGLIIPVTESQSQAGKDVQDNQVQPWTDHYFVN